jgi:hypothetical protein
VGGEHLFQVFTAAFAADRPVLFSGNQDLADLAAVEAKKIVQWHGRPPYALKGADSVTYSVLANKISR